MSGGKDSKADPPAVKAPAASGWGVGGFLSKALANVEQQLDRALDSTAAPPVLKKEQLTPSPAPSTGRMTMQERLAMALARGKTVSPQNGGNGSPRGSLDVQRPLSSEPRKSTDSQRSQTAEVKLEAPSVEVKEIETKQEPEQKDNSTSENVKVNIEGDQGAADSAVTTTDINSAVTQSTEPSPTSDLPTFIAAALPLMGEALSAAQSGAATPNLPSPSSHIDNFHTPQESASQTRPASASSECEPTKSHMENGVEEEFANAEQDSGIIAQLRAALEASEAKREEEQQTAAKRIEELEGELNARSSSDAQRVDISTQLAERDERIQALLEEGEKLSKKELQLNTTIKALRKKAMDDEKAITDTKRRQEKTEKDLADVRQKLKASQEVERLQADRIKTYARTENELNKTRAERDKYRDDADKLRAELGEARARAVEAIRSVQTAAMESERAVSTGLRAELERAKSAAAKAADDAEAAMSELRAKMARDAERARTTEDELRAEIVRLEQKLEVVRSRAEEASAAALNKDTHVGLMRQIEMLQTQQSVARENWRVLEGAMLNKTAALEKEKEEWVKKEAELRKKLKDTKAEMRDLEDECDELKTKVAQLENDLNTMQESQTRHSNKVKELENELQSAQKARDEQIAELDKLKKDAEADLQSRLQEEKLKWEQEYNSPPMLDRMLSPTAPMSPSVPPISRRVTCNTSDLMINLPKSPNPQSWQQSFPRRNSGRAYTPAHETIPDHDWEDDRDVSPETPRSPHARTPRDQMSVSTNIGPGPSVSIMERMSANVRRLESELTGLREEIANISSEREAARQECVQLLSELEEKRSVASQLDETARELQTLQARYDSALELLGEKEESLQELRMDVKEIKEMYKEQISELVGQLNAK
ncbi:hypothetical protein YB2330_006052 [Saitoella coloradoensis]